MEPKYLSNGYSRRINPKYHETRSDKGFYVLGNIVTTAIVATAILYSVSLIDSHIQENNTKTAGIEQIISR